MSNKYIIKIFVSFVFGFSCNSLFALGFNNEYEVRIGSYSGAADDLYIRQIPKIILLHGAIVTPILIQSPVEDFVLENNGNGTFTIINNLTNTQKQAFSDWGEASNINILLEDINNDNFLDIYLDGLKGGLSENNQFIFSPNDNISQPTIVAFDQYINQFATQSWNAINSTTSLVSQLEEINFYYYGYTSSYTGVAPAACLASSEECGFAIDDPDDPGGWDPVNDPNQVDVYHHWGWDTENQTVEVRDYEPNYSLAALFVDVYDSFLEDQEIIPNSTASNSLEGIFDTLYGNNLFTFGDTNNPNLDDELEEEWDYWGVIKAVISTTWNGCWESASDIWNCVVVISPTFGPFTTYCTSTGQYSYAITTTQANYVTQEDRSSFWASRWEDSCDPFAPMALSVVEDVGFGKVTLDWLEKVAENENVTFNEQQIGIEMMQQHKSVTENDSYGVTHLLSPKQITDYHTAVFENNNLPEESFGGNPFAAVGGGFWGDLGGRWAERVIWCDGCDVVPK